MKKLLTILFLVISLVSLGQSETHDFITYDTTINIFYPPWGPTATWLIRISRPRNYFTPNNPDTTSRPWLLSMPGQGELGSTDTNHLHAYGPHYWIQHGWDGGVQLGNGRHYPLLITLIYVNSVNTVDPFVYDIIDTLVKKFHPRARGRHYMGLSEGSFTFGSLVCFEKAAGTEDGMKLMTSFIALEGEPNPPYYSWDRRQGAYKVWAAKYGGRYFTLEGNGSDNFRNTWKWSQPMNDTVPNSAYFSWETLGGGAHCCWNSMYDPSATNWNCVTPPALGPNNGSGPAPNTMGSYRIGQNLFAWALAQGDTTLISNVPCNPIITTGGDQTITLPSNSITTTGSATSQCGNTITSTVWTETSGPNTATITAPNNLVTSFNNLIQGTYVFKLTVTDNTGASATANLTCVVNPVGRSCRVFVWPSSQTNINITNANVVPAGQDPLHGCDVVEVVGAGRPGGYRTISASNIGSMTDSQDIVIQFMDSAHMIPNNGTVLGNTFDSLNHVRFKGVNMTGYSDPFAFKFANLAHSHFVTWDSCIFKNQPGLFPSSTPNFTSLPLLDTTNMYDTVNVFYKLRVHNCRFDSTLYNGLTAIWFNGATTNPPLNQIYLCPEIDSNFFNNYLSHPNPSTYINITAAFGAKIHDNIFQNLGVDTPYVGHAAVLFTKFSLIYFYRNRSGTHNFGNDFRARGSGTIKQFEWLLKRENPLYNQKSWICFNYVDHKVKYPAFEIGVNPSDSTLKWYIPTRSPMVFNNTMFRPALGFINRPRDPYHNSMIDAYGASWDTVVAKNNVEIGPNMDTTAWNFTVTGSAGPAVSGLLITYTNGATKNDTASNLIVGTWNTNWYSDSVSWKPVLNGTLYNQGIGTNLPIGAPGITDQDYFHNPYPTQGRGPLGKGQGIDIGAFQLIQPLIINSLYFPIHTTITGPKY